MARGQAAAVGDRNISANGYHYIRTSTGWRLEHHVIAERRLGRPVDTSKDRIFFRDSDRNNLDPANIGVKPRGGSSLGRRRARLVARIDKQIALEDS
jgi:hypothetical protein